jgi:Tfp pilus assembly protein PilV
MRTIFATTRPPATSGGALRSSAARLRTRQRPKLPGSARGSILAKHPRPGSEAGFLLIEVIVSALLVALIVLATFAGFDVVNRTSADQRSHDEAALLAAQSQEQLRTDSASALDALVASAHTYSPPPVDGTTYAIKQTAQLITDTEQNSVCNAVGATQSEHRNNYFRISSSVTWPALAAARPPVTQSSVITPPAGSGLEVDVTNGATPEANAAGVTVISNANGGAPLTTGTGGCVAYAGIPSTTASVEAYKLGYVTETGAFKVFTKEVTIAPNLTTHYPVKMALGGAIAVAFTYNASSKYERESGKPETVETVKGDTFVVSNPGVIVAPKFEVGGTNLSITAEGQYEAVTGKYEPSAKTPISATQYPTGDLFPFNGAWSVYAGDCTANSPSVVTAEAVKSQSASVKEGMTPKVSVPMAYLLLDVYEGTKATPKSLANSASYPVKITNTACSASPIPNNASKANLEHTQNTTTVSPNQGHLEDPFQPFGKATLCLAYNSGATHRTYTVSYELKAEAPLTEKIYLKATASYESVVVTSTGSTEAKC